MVTIVVGIGIIIFNLLVATIASYLIFRLCKGYRHKQKEKCQKIS